MTSRRVNLRAVVVSDRTRANVITHLTPELDNAFLALCVERKMTRAAVLRELIKAAVAEHEERVRS